MLKSAKVFLNVRLQFALQRSTVAEVIDEKDLSQVSTWRSNEHRVDGTQQRTEALIVEDNDHRGGGQLLLRVVPVGALAVAKVGHNSVHGNAVTGGHVHAVGVHLRVHPGRRRVGLSVVAGSIEGRAQLSRGLVVAQDAISIDRLRQLGVLVTGGHVERVIALRRVIRVLRGELFTVVRLPLRQQVQQVQQTEENDDKRPGEWVSAETANVQFQQIGRHAAVAAADKLITADRKR